MGINIPNSFYTKLGQIESNNQLYAKAPTSSASGVFQFLKSTWEQFGGSWGNNSALAFGGLKPSYEDQISAVKKLTEQNATYLDNKGVTVSPASLYAAHFLGAGTAAKVLGADANTSVQSIAGNSAVKANPFLKGMSVSDFWNWLTGAKGLSSNPFDGGGTGSGSGIFQCPHCGGNIKLRITSD